MLSFSGMCWSAKWPRPALEHFRSQDCVQSVIESIGQRVGTDADRPLLLLVPLQVRIRGGCSVIACPVEFGTGFLRPETGAPKGPLRRYLHAETRNRRPKRAKNRRKTGLSLSKLSTARFGRYWVVGTTGNHFQVRSSTYRNPMDPTSRTCFVAQPNTWTESCPVGLATGLHTSWRRVLPLG